MRRAVLLWLTDAGAELQREVGRRHARHVAKALTDRLDPTALTQLESLCRQLTTRHFEPQENQK